jgi:hypothetical protein
MAKWFKRSKRSGITYTTYLNGKPTTWSQSYKDGSTRTTYTHRGGNITVTKTTKQGGFTKIEKRAVSKKQKPKKYKAWKPKHRVKWGKSPKRYKIKRIRVKSINLSFKTLILLILFSFSPLIVDIIKELFN